MISTISSNPDFHNVVISTGNILNSSNNPTTKTSEELLNGLKLTLLCDKSENHVELIDGQILRSTRELNAKLTEGERSNLSVSVKIFLNKYSKNYIDEAIKSVLKILKVQYLDNIVLSYHFANGAIEGNCDESETTAATTNSNKSDNVKEKAMKELKQLWTTLEEFSINKQVKQLGIADLDIDTLSQLHTGSRIKPTIAQINLSKCCVVPPALQEFCTTNDIQLLTHSDPEILLSDEHFVIPDYTINWVVRYQVHIRCRGVLTAKGFVLGANKK